MPIINAFKQALELLGRNDKRRLYVAIASQILVSVFDLLGVLLIGAITLIATNLKSNKPLPGAISTTLEFAHLDKLPTTQLLISLGILAISMFVIRSIGAPLLLRRILRFLTGRSAEISGKLTEILFSQTAKEVHWTSSQQVAFSLGSGVSSAIGDTIGASLIIFAEASLLLMMGTLLMLIDPLVTIFTLIYFGLVMFVIQYFLGRISAKAAQRKFAADVAGAKAVQELVSSYREIFVGDHVEFYVDKFAGVRREGSAAQSTMQLVSYIPKYVLEASLIVGAGLLAAFEFMVKSPSAAVATLILFLTAASRIFPSLLRIQGSATAIRASSSGARYTIELLGILKSRNAFPMVAQPTAKTDSSKSTQPFRPEIKVDNISFTYDPEGPATIDNVSLQIKQGEFVAIVGPTGSGKSTLVDLILGVSEPNAGELTISGLPPREAVKVWPGQIGFVPQLVAMSDASVRENVAQGVPTAQIDEGRVWQVLEQVRLADILRESREGLDTEVGERGIKFSGGQRQRLGLARALYSNPSLLVLDEATSALDSETELAVSQAIEQLGADVTRITIAHRLATVMHADKVIYLDAGKVLAAGTFEEVRNQVPEFDQQAKLLGL